MGCAPNPEEVQLGKSFAKNREAEILHESSSKKIDLLHLLLHQLTVEYSNQPKLSAGLNELLNRKKPVTRMDTLPDEGDPDNFYRYLSDMGRAADYNYSKARDMERLFCDLHVKFYLIYDAHPELLNSNAKDDIQAVVNNYIEHRKEDVDTWIAWLNSQRNSAESTLTYGEQSRSIKAGKLVEKIDAEIERVKSLSEKEILKDNKLFARNPEEFDLTKNVYQ